tara:strand:+ start:727 stop:1869 length:1143 start_codon:yes stop_codon:yes gene_type:complete
MAKKKNNIHIVGTGTIGLPLIGLFTRHKKSFDIDEVTFHKNTPLKHDIPNVKKLLKAGAKLCTDDSKFEDFSNLGATPLYNRAEAIENADVIIDCTPRGTALEHKKDSYLPNYLRFINSKDKERFFIAQGSEKGFGKIYAHGINDKALNKNDNFLQIASCNTHAGASLINTLSKLGDIASSNFVYIRRSNDISQNSSMTPSIDVDGHKDWLYGTHHARDIHDVFKTLEQEINVYSSACKINTQLMHTLQFNIIINSDKKINIQDVVGALSEDRMIATTNHTTANKIFSYGREFGHYGRILNHVVVPLEPISCRLINAVRFIGQDDDGNKQYSITGFAYTPQDGNSLLSSVAAALWFLNDRSWGQTNKKLQTLKKYLFQEI